MYMSATRWRHSPYFVFRGLAMSADIGSFPASRYSNEFRDDGPSSRSMICNWLFEVVSWDIRYFNKSCRVKHSRDLLFHIVNVDPRDHLAQSPDM